tara:strand:+ start:918 stop:1115 length:198 start_codon:yes stop_codon:yes gene_type:complete
MTAVLLVKESMNALKFELRTCWREWKSRKEEKECIYTIEGYAAMNTHCTNTFSMNNTFREKENND